MEDKDRNNMQCGKFVGSQVLFVSRVQMWSIVNQPRAIISHQIKRMLNSQRNKNRKRVTINKH